uniref:MFS domain-containing protein n=1 Tax=Rhodnius prolixus TaxID=13249 RepID=T1HPR3_RHOPR
MNLIAFLSANSWKKKQHLSERRKPDYCYRYGRKTVMLASGPLSLLSWMIAITTRSLISLYIIRIIQGLTVGITFTVVPIYLAEITEPKLRGQLGTYFQIFWYVGLVHSYATGPYFDYQTYLYLACIQPVLFFVCFICIPETPYYLLMAKKEEEAFKALSWLRANKDVAIEFAEIKESVEEEMKNNGSWKDLVATKKDRMALLIVQVACVVKYMSGMAALVLYATQTFSESSRLNLTSDQMTLMIPLILIVTTWLTSLMADTVGRRPLMIVSSIGSVVCHTIVAVYYYLDKETDIDVSSYMWITYASLISFCVITNVGVGPLLMTIQAEYFPSHTRAKGGIITGIVGGLASFVNIRQYQFVEDYFGLYMNYVIFALICLAGTILFSAILHETAGKSLGEIQRNLSDTINVDNKTKRLP